MTTEPITESQLAEHLGIERRVLRAIREAHLEHPFDFSFEKKGGATYTVAGHARVLSILREKNGAPAHDVDAVEAFARELVSAPKKEPRAFYVARLVANHRVLLACPDPRRKEPAITVRVRDSARYAVGMEIQATLVAGATWQIFGPPPRRRSQRSTILR